jgi:sugar lactone lactonase YvrE
MKNAGWNHTAGFLGRLFFLGAAGLMLGSCSSGGGGGGGSSKGAVIATWAGDGTQGFDGDGGDRTASWFNSPMEMTFGPDGLAYIVDWNNHRIRRVKANGTIETLIGLNIPGDWPCQDPDDPADCEVPLDGTVQGSELGLNHPMDIAFDSDGNGVIAAWHNHKVEHFDPSTGAVTILAGQMAPGFTGDGGPGIDARMNFPDSIVIDGAGNIFASDERSNRVRRISGGANAVITTVVGSNNPPVVSGYSGDGGPAASAVLALTAYDEAGGADNPPAGGGLAMDGDGNLYVADTFNHCVRKIVPGSDGILGDGDPAEEIITTFAGTCGESTSGGLGKGALLSAINARFNQPHDLDFGPDGRLYVTDTANHAIRSVDPSSGEVETVAGTGAAGFSGDGDSATKARLNKPYGTAFDVEGNLFVIDRDNNRIRVVRVSTSTVTTAPALTLSASPSSGAPPLTVSLSADASDPDGGDMVGYDWDFNNDGTIDQTTAVPEASTVLSDEGSYTIRVRARDDEGQSAKATILVVVSQSGSTACTEPEGAVVVSGASGTILTIAGTGIQATDPVDGDGDGQVDCATVASSSNFDTPMDVTIGPDGRAYISDWNGHKIRVLGGNGYVGHVMGTGIEGDACETVLNADGSCPAHKAQVNHPTGVAFDPEGRMLVAAWHNSKVKRADLAAETAQNICGDGGRAFKGDGGPCKDSGGNDLVSFDLVSGVISDGDGNVFVSDQANQVVRRIGSDGTIKTVAGNCPVTAVFGCIQGQGYDGDGGPATQAHLSNELNQATDPQGRIVLDGAGNLYIADTDNNVIRKVTPGPDGVVGDGDPSLEIITTVAGTGAAGFGGDGGQATSALLNGPRDVAVAGDGTLYIADTGNNCVRMVAPNGVISKVAGRCGEPGAFAGTGGPAFLAALNQPYGIELDSEGNLYIADTLNNRIRVVVK